MGVGTVRALPHLQFASLTRRRACARVGRGGAHRRAGGDRGPGKLRGRGWCRAGALLPCPGPTAARTSPWRPRRAGAARRRARRRVQHGCDGSTAPVRRAACPDLAQAGAARAGAVVCLVTRCGASRAQMPPSRTPRASAGSARTAPTRSAGRTTETRSRYARPPPPPVAGVRRSGVGERPRQRRHRAAHRCRTVRAPSSPNLPQWAHTHRVDGVCT